MSVTAGERDDLPGGGPQESRHRDHRPDEPACTPPSRSRRRLPIASAAGEGQWIDTSLFDSAVAMMGTLDPALPRHRAGRPRRARQCRTRRTSMPSTRPSPWPAAATSFSRWATTASSRNSATSLRPRRVGARSALRDERGARPPPRRARAVDRGGDAHTSRGARDGSMRSKPRACPAAPSTRSIGCSPLIRTRSTTRCGFDLPHALAGIVPRVKAPIEFSATPIHPRAGAAAARRAYGAGVAGAAGARGGCAGRAGERRRRRCASARAALVGPQRRRGRHASSIVVQDVVGVALEWRVFSRIARIRSFP